MTERSECPECGGLGYGPMYTGRGLEMELVDCPRCKSKTASECPACDWESDTSNYRGPGNDGPDHTCGHKPTDAPRSAGVKRWEPGITDEGMVTMDAYKNGHYVLATDYEARVAALEADNGRLREALGDARQFIDDCVSSLIFYFNAGIIPTLHQIDHKRKREEAVKFKIDAALHPTSEAE